MRVQIDAEKLTGRTAAHEYLKELFCFPDYYGCNLDALADCLSEMRDLEVEIINERKAGGYFPPILKVLSGVCARNGFRLIDEDSREAKVYRCAVCGYIFDEAKEGKKLSEIEVCPKCRKSAEHFVPYEMKPCAEPKTVVCFGDSNTYGYDPVGGGRLSKNVRWPGRLAGLLGSGFEVIEEGCNGRTTIYKDPEAPWKSGLEYLKPCLNSHKPVDVLILMLGSNDLKMMFGLSAEQVAAGAERLIEEVDEFVDEKLKIRPKIILVSPSEIGEGIATTSEFRRSFDETAIARSKELSGYYREVAERTNCTFLDAAQIVVPSKEDSLHWMPEEHAKFAESICRCVKSLF